MNPSYLYHTYLFELEQIYSTSTSSLHQIHTKTPQKSQFFDRIGSCFELCLIWHFVFRDVKGMQVKLETRLGYLIQDVFDVTLVDFCK